MLLSSIGKHIQLNKLDATGQDTFFMFPGTTADDVYVNELGCILTDFLPSVASNVNAIGDPLTAKQLEVVTVSNDVLAALTTVPVVSP